MRRIGANPESRKDLQEFFEKWPRQGHNYANTVGIVRDGMLAKGLLSDAEVRRGHKWIKKTKLVSDYVEGNYTNNESRKNVYIALRIFARLVFDKKTNSPEEEFYKSRMSQFAKNSTMRYTTQKMSKTEEAKWLDWEELLTAINKYIDESNVLPLVKKINENWHQRKQTNLCISPKDERKLQDVLILMIYTRLPPLRAEWRDVKQCNFDADTENYVDLKNHRVVFHQYKTAHTYGENVVDLDPSRDLWQVIIAACRLCRERCTIKSDFLLHTSSGGQFSTRSNFGNRVYCLTERIVGKKIGPNMFRKIFITHFLKQAPRKQLQDKIARLQGHSVATQNLYRRFFEDFQDASIENVMDAVDSASISES